MRWLRRWLRQGYEVCYKCEIGRLIGPKYVRERPSWAKEGIRKDALVYTCDQCGFLHYGDPIDSER